VRGARLAGFERGLELSALDGTWSNLVSDVHVERSRYSGISANWGTTANIVAGVTIANTTTGIDFNKTGGMIVSRATIAFTTQAGIEEVQAGWRSTWQHILVTDSGSGGGTDGAISLGLFGSSASGTPPREDCLFVNAVALRSATTGVEVHNSIRTRMRDVVIGGHQGAFAIRVTDQTDVAFAGTVGFADAAPACERTDTSTGVDAVCATGAVSRYALAVAEPFAGAIATDDPANAADAAGSAAHDSIDDWAHFGNAWRVWGPDARGATPSAGCRTGTCRIWDLRLVDRPGNALLDRTGDGLTPNPPFVPGAACPAPVGGDVAEHDANGNVFLTHAYEELDDSVGDDDALCESGETCVYAPNFGAYQGEGSLIGPCTFADGIVAHVAMLGWSQNGATP